VRVVQAVNTKCWDSNRASPASERRGNTFKGLKDFDLQVNAKIQLWLFYMCHIRSQEVQALITKCWDRFVHFLLQSEK